MIKEVFLTKAPATMEERWKIELSQGLILNHDSLPDGFFLDLGQQVINGETYYVSIQVIW